MIVHVKFFYLNYIHSASKSDARSSEERFIIPRSSLVKCHDDSPLKPIQEPIAGHPVLRSMLFCDLDK